MTDPIDSLVSTDWLADELGADDLRVFDTTVLMSPGDDGSINIESGADAWAQGHIPTSGHLDLIDELSDPTSSLGFTAPSPDALAAALAARGVGDDTRVVLYDTVFNMWATRVWWLMRSIGFDNAAVLDGGLVAWQHDGKATSTEPAPVHPEATLTASPRPGNFTDSDGVQAAVSTGSACILNALSEDNHNGNDPGYGRPGHIPGANNVPAMNLLDHETRRYRPLDELPAAFDAAQERLTDLLELTRKYARTEPELVRLRARLREQLDRLATDDGIPAVLVAAGERARERLNAAGRALHAARKKVARRASVEAGPLLEELGMIGASLEFQMATEADPEGPLRLEGRRVAALAAGPASVTLLARTNPGERLSPVDKGASGGELSRIALVLRSLALRGQAPALLLLDEVDAGIGADLAGAVAGRLAALAEAGQLLVISHQAHIAAAADRHLVVLKATDDERASSEIRILDRAGRVEEIVRMLGANTPESQRLASELLAAGGAA